jgi:hypothetical protein
MVDEKEEFSHGGFIRESFAGDQIHLHIISQIRVSQRINIHQFMIPLPMTFLCSP